jgi:RNA polymerase sigma-70 factor (ECF subfamily)
MVAVPLAEVDVQALYVKYGYLLFRRCLTFMGDEATAQDAVQEVFVRALQSADGFRGDADPKTWLCRISDHHCIDLLRRRKTRGEREGPSSAAPDRDGEPHGGGEDELARTPSIRNDDPEAILTARRLMNAMDPATRRLAVLYFVDELTQDEMAAELGLSRRTIGKQLKKLSARASALLGERKRVP